MLDESDTSKWFASYCHDMEVTLGRGWKRRLAAKVGVSESNVQTWLKSGRVPPAVHRAITLHDELEELRDNVANLLQIDHSRWIEEEMVHGERRFSVHEMNPKTGRAKLVAGNIAEENDAREIANLPLVQERIDKAYDRLGLEDMYPDPVDQASVKALENPGWRDLTARERAAQIQKDSNMEKGTEK